MHPSPSSSLLIGLIAVLAGCSSNEKYSDEDYEDVATAVGALVGTRSTGEASSMRDAVEITSGNVDNHLAKISGGSWQASRAGLTYGYDVTCRDGQGETQDSCDANTDSASLVLTWRGDLDLPRYDANVDRTGEWTVSGLQSDNAVFHGQGAFEVETEFSAWLRPVTRSFRLTYDATYDAVAFDRVSGQIVAGTIHYGVEAQRTTSREDQPIQATIEVEVDIVFTGNGQARISVDGVRDYDLDLSSGRIIDDRANDVL